MSSYEPKHFRLGEPIDREVAEHITNLQEVFRGYDSESRTAYIDLQGATPWIKMQSGALLDQTAANDYNTEIGSYLAEENVLFGLNKRTIEDIFEEGNSTPISTIKYDRNTGILPGYSETSFGIRPNPGITAMSIQSHNRFGSLRTAIVSFQCWSKEQMDIMEVLYMRPGVTVLLEWGHSLILKSQTEVKPSDMGIDFFTSSTKTPELIKLIDEKRKTESFGYDAIVGIIKNFSWSFRPDGGYDCQVHLVISGDLIESYKANFYLKQKEITAELAEEVASYLATQPAGSTIQFPSVQHDSTTPYNLDQVGNGLLEAAYQRFCGNAQHALDQGYDSFLRYLNTLPDQAARLKELTDMGLNGDLGYQALLNGLKILFDSLCLVKGQTPITRISRVAKEKGNSMYGSLGDQWVSMNLKSPWTSGIVDLNTAENNLEEGKLVTGFIAVLPFKPGSTIGDKDTPMRAFTQALRELHITEDDPDNDRPGPSRAMYIVLTLLSKGLYEQGTEQKTVFKFNTSYYNYISYGSYGSNRDSKLGIQLLYEENSSSYPNFYGLDLNPPAYIDGDETTDSWNYYGYRLAPAGAMSAAYQAGRRVSAMPMIQARQYRLSATGVGPALFTPLLFTGNDLLENTRTDTEQVIYLQDENGDPVAGYIDPNDDNFSRLHYILRAKLENTYVSKYLRESFEQANFSAVFRYRQVFDAPGGLTPPTDIEKIFVDERNGGNLRTNNLKKYNFDNSENTYEKQLLSWNYVLGGRFVPGDNSPTYNTLYLKLGALLELINQRVLKSDNNYFFLFKSMYKNKFTTPLYNTMDDHISCDPEICILPHNIDDLSIPRDEGTGFLIDISAPIILNIELSYNFILSTLNKYIDANGSVSILTFLQEILDEVSRVCGGINDLQIQYRENSSIFHIVDRRCLAPIGADEYPIVNIYGLDSIIKNVSMVSKITPKISSMIAISAQDTSFTSTQDASGFGAIMNGVTDRIYGDRYDDDRKERIQANSTYPEVRDMLLTDVINLKTHLKTYYITRVIPRIGKDTQPGVYQNYMNFLTGADSKYQKANIPTYSFIIPFELQLDMYGLSGVQVMDSFRINKEIVPKTYGGREGVPIAFLITGVEHQINRGTWTTKLRTQIYNVDEYRPSLLYPNRSLKLIEGVSTVPDNGNGNESRSSIISEGVASGATTTTTSTGASTTTQQSLEDLGIPAFTGAIQFTPWDELSQSRKDTALYLYNTALEAGFSVNHARAILAVVYKETAFRPAGEDSYMNTPQRRLKEIWGGLFGHFPSEDDGVLLKDLIAQGKFVEGITTDEEFQDYVYGYLRPGKNGNYGGNDSPGDGKKYRGGGLNQLTFKDTYIKMYNLYKEAGSPAGDFDFATNPAELNRQDTDGIYKVASHVAVIFFKSAIGNRETPNASELQALYEIYFSNAGWGNAGNWTTFRTKTFAKCHRFLDTMPETL